MVPKLRVLIAYLTYSGNTQEVATIIQDELHANEVETAVHRIGIDPPVFSNNLGTNYHYDWNRVIVNSTVSWKKYLDNTRRRHRSPTLS